MTALRIGVPAELAELPAETGHGRMWRSVLDGLGATSGVRLVRGGSLPWRRPHVWLADGHPGPLPVSEPVVSQVHEVGWLDPELRDTLGHEFYTAIASGTEASVAAASRVITPSEVAREQVLAAYDIEPERVRAVPHGVDHAVFRAGLEGGREAVAELRGGQAAPYVLFVSLLHPRKNLGALREAMAGLARRGFPHVLVIVGARAHDRPDAEEIERAAVADLPGLPDRLVRVVEPSHEQLAALMAGADAFCLPSLYEGFGLTALEAMACGVPVLVSDRGALPEVVGDAGMVVPPTPEAVEDALARVLSEPELAARLRSAAAARAQQFTWERTTAGWLSVLTDAARGRRG